MVNVLPAVTGLTRAALDLLFPTWCLGCGREGAYLCPACREQLTAVTAPVCDVCGRPLSGPGACPNCAGLSLATDGIRAPFLFGGLVRRAIHEFKYNNLRGLAPVLAGFLRDFMTANGLRGDVLVPVPLHPRRLRERGYNQAALLARELGRSSGLPVAADALRRTSHTVPLARTATVEERRARVKEAFAARGGQVEGKSVILIDDVSTSGATMSAAAAALKAAGAATVTGLAVALEA
jgi:competence protein ComFC